MVTRETPHPTDQVLRAHVLECLDARFAVAVSRHLESCRPCRRRVAEITSGSNLARSSDGRRDSGLSAPADSSSVGGAKRDVDASPATPPAAEVAPPGLAENPDYEVIRELGRGGMGVVYLARNRLMGRLEVLKVVSGHLLDRSTVRERFFREIRNAAQLHHPNIVTAYSAVRAGDRIVLAMEYLDGADLAAIVKSHGPLPVAHAALVAYQVAQGLQHAHERGMVHRDIKPENLMLAREGKRSIVKILDFGLAKATREAPVDGGLTREGQMLGTPNYIAPEQSIDAQKADIRADIYSLGCTLYYLLTGAPPFEAHSLYEILQAHHSRDALPLNLARPEVPVELAALVARMMAKEPGHRFQTPGEVAVALKPFFMPGQVTAFRGPAAGASRAEDATGTGKSTAAQPRTGTGRTPTPATAGGEGWRPAGTHATPSVIDLVPTESRSSERPARGEPAPAPLRWLWTVAALVALMAGFVLIWKAGVDAGRGHDDTSARATITSYPANTPRVTPPSRLPKRVDETARPVVRDKPHRDESPRPASIAGPSSTMPEVAKEPDRLRPNPAAPVAAETPRIAERNEPVLDIRHLGAWTGLVRLADADSRRPSEGFWPPLAPDDFEDWRVSDPDSLRMGEEGVSVSAGSRGNFLLTRREGYRDCKLTADVSVPQGTEAFLTLRAHLGPDGWRGITSRLADEGGRIHAGGEGTDFGLAERGTPLVDIPPSRRIHVVFQVDREQVSQLVVRQKKTCTTSHANRPSGQYSGAIGFFVKSGTLIIHSLDVQ